MRRWYICLQAWTSAELVDEEWFGSDIARIQYCMLRRFDEEHYSTRTVVRVNQGDSEWRAIDLAKVVSFIEAQRFLRRRSAMITSFLILTPYQHVQLDFPAILQSWLSSRIKHWLS